MLPIKSLLSQLIRHIIPFGGRSELEKKIDYRFRDLRLLELALTHRSLSDAPHRNLERLEFLGDAVLSHLVSKRLFMRFPSATEGDLTMRRSALVNKKYLAKVGETLELHKYLKVSSGVNLKDDKVRQNLGGDALESLLGAIYLDGGMRAANKFTLRHIWVLGGKATKIENPKGRLIELCHRTELGSPKFILLGMEGPEHDKKFQVQVQVNKQLFEAASGRSKKAAEQAAAFIALNELNGISGQ